VTDFDWYQFLAGRPDIDEVNFWQPSGAVGFKALEPGGLFLFKLHSPRDLPPENWSKLKESRRGV
jgi:putative restriction endonuclease